VRRHRKHRFSKGMKRRALKLAGSCCTVCSDPLSMATAESHHIVHVCQGGATVADNLQIVCRECHVKIHKIKKGNK